MGEENRMGVTIDDTRFKIKALTSLAKVTTDYCQRERLCREAKFLLDMLEPHVVIDADLVIQFLESGYEITFDRKDKVLKRELDQAFLKWNQGKGYMLSKKELTAKMVYIGIQVNPRGCYGDKKGVYVYEGIRERQKSEK